MLFGVFDWPNSDPVKKYEWIGKFETIYAAVH